MKLLNRPFKHYLRQARLGIALLLVVAIVRFLLKPIFDIPYEQGTLWASLTVLQPILMLVYSVVVARKGGTFRDLLGVAASLALFAALLIIVSIAIDDFGGIDTYYTDPDHGGRGNPWGHMWGHVVGGVISTPVLWAVGSLVYLAAGGLKRAAA